jgi:hypothetical protein
MGFFLFFFRCIYLPLPSKIYTSRRCIHRLTRGADRGEMTFRWLLSNGRIRGRIATTLPDLANGSGSPPITYTLIHDRHLTRLGSVK